MTPPHDGPRPRSSGILAFLLAFSTASGGSTDTGDLAPWPRSRPQAIRVDRGRAAFDVPATAPGSRTLVIVSALARQGGPFPIRLSARPIDHPRPVARSSAEPRRPPKLDMMTPVTRPAPVAGLPPSRRTFHLPVRGNDLSRVSSYVPVEGRLTAVGRRIQVYVDARDLGAVSEATLRDLVATFDEAIDPVASRRFGPAADIDGDGRFTVLFSSWLNQIAGGKGSVDGFVRGADLDIGFGPPFGNRCDVMYLSTNLAAGSYLRTIVAHEYTHAVNFSRKALATHPATLEEEGWLDEGLAHLVEDELGFSKANIDYRVSAFLSKPERYRLVVDDYYAADLFRSHGNRGATYLFLRWCVDRHGPDLLDALIRSKDRGVANLEAATGSTFADLFRRWTVALAMTGIDPASQPDEAYQSIDPRGEFEDWVLAGPRMTSVVPGAGDDTWSAQPTTAHYAVIENPGRGAVAIEVVGPVDAELQVTAVRLPAGSGRPELTVHALPTDGGALRVRAELVERGGDCVRLGALAWEPLVPRDDPRARQAARGGFDRLGIASSFGTSALPAGGRLRSGAIRLPEARPGDPPLIFKAVGTDSRGRRVAAWSEISPMASSGGS